MVDKLEAQIEYEEAHDHMDEADKLQNRIQDIVDKADSRAKNPEHGAAIKVVHHGHKKKHEEETHA